jgi:hypothetical protein
MIPGGVFQGIISGFKKTPPSRPDPADSLQLPFPFLQQHAEKLRFPVTPAKAGVQNPMKILDSGFRRDFLGGHNFPFRGYTIN